MKNLTLNLLLALTFSMLFVCSCKNDSTSDTKVNLELNSNTEKTNTSPSEVSKIDGLPASEIEAKELNEKFDLSGEYLATKNSESKCEGSNPDDFQSINFTKNQGKSDSKIIMHPKEEGLPMEFNFHHIDAKNFKASRQKPCDECYEMEISGKISDDNKVILTITDYYNEENPNTCVLTLCKKEICGVDAIQQRLDKGESPLQIVNSGIAVEKLYGKKYEGGLIFFIDTKNKYNFEGLVAAEKDQSSGEYFESVIGAESDRIGAGAENTKKSASLTRRYSPEVKDGAILLCDELDLNGKTDWFLPSSGELYAMYNNLHSKGHGGFAARRYWNSYQSDEQGAEMGYADFKTGDFDSIFKLNYKGKKNLIKCNVRAARAFHSNETSKTDPSMGTSKTDLSNETSKTDLSNETSKTDPSNGISKTDPSNGTSKTDSSNGTSKTDSSNETSNTDSSKGNTKTDESYQATRRILQDPIETLELSVRSYNVLKVAKISTVGDLVSLSSAKASELQVRGMNDNVAKELEHVITGKGLNLVWMCRNISLMKIDHH